MPLKQNRIPALRAGLRPAVARGTARAAGYVADLAQQLCPVDTGALRQSIQVEPPQPAERMAVTAGRGLTYAHYVEYGTSRSPAQPFLIPAARAVDVAREIRAELRTLIRRSRAR